MQIKFTGQCLGVSVYKSDKGQTYLSANFVDKANGKVFKLGSDQVAIPEEAIQVLSVIELEVVAEQKFNKLFVDIMDAKFTPVKK